MRALKDLMGSKLRNTLYRIIDSTIYHRKGPRNRIHLNGHTLGHTQKLQLPLCTEKNVLAAMHNITNSATGNSKPDKTHKRKHKDPKDSLKCEQAVILTLL